MKQKTETHQLDEARAFYASYLAACAQSSNPNLRRAFEQVRREAFLPPGPWRISVVRFFADCYIDTPSSDPIHLYHDVLVALDKDKGLNNGQPSLHAVWMEAVEPQPGDMVVHIGIGRGYYSAILSVLVEPDGFVNGFEINDELAAAAKEHLASYENVSIAAADAVTSKLPATDVIYVNASVTAPPLEWLKALRPGGRLIYPWRLTEELGVAVLVTRRTTGLAVKLICNAQFTPCIGASDLDSVGSVPDDDTVLKTRSIRLRAEQQPDETATVVYKDIWYSSDGVLA